jgi:hypothetical protein
MPPGTSAARTTSTTTNPDTPEMKSTLPTRAAADKSTSRRDLQASFEHASAHAASADPPLVVKGSGGVEGAWKSEDLRMGSRSTNYVRANSNGRYTFKVVDGHRRHYFEDTDGKLHIVSKVSLA